MMNSIEVACYIEANIETVWEAWTNPAHIVHWNFASDDWCAPSAVNHVFAGGSFSWRMEARDGSMGFDFRGTYTKIEPMKKLNYTLDDFRKVEVGFTEKNGRVLLSEKFEPESENSRALQQAGWQAILDNFKKYVESIPSTLK